MQQTRSPVWPAALLLVCLAAIALTAFGWWQLGRPVRVTKTAGRSVATPSGASEPVAEASSGWVGAASQEQATHVEKPGMLVADLARYAVPRRHVRPAPPVADRITMDPSLAKTPLLPHIQPSLRSDAVRDEAVKSMPQDVPSVADAAATPLVRQDVHRAPDIANSWPYAAQLLELLAPLESDAATCQWCGRMRDRLEALHAIESLGDPEAGVVLGELQQLAHEGMAISGGQREVNQRAAILRAAYALQRRLAVWQPVHQLAVPTVTQVSLRHSDPAQLAGTLQAADGQLNRLRDPQAWREYLLMDQLAAIVAQQWLPSSVERSKLAREFLRRLEAADSGPEQESFFAHAAWQQVAGEVRRWVCEPVDYETMLDDLERVEADGGQTAAEDLAGHYQVLRWSATPEIAELGERINSYYRNANIRVAISGELLNRLLPHPQTVNERVSDQLMGGLVQGQSRVTTRLRLVLFPDRERWRMGLEARGDVDSRTQTDRGPARFHNAGRSRYRVNKMLLIDRRGVHTEDAEGTALTNADLTGVETDLDGVPLVNLLVRAVAKQLYDRQAEDAQDEAEGLLARRAISRMDREVDQKLGDATGKFRQEIWQPLHGLGLRPEAVDMQTTEQRLIARYRLAGFDQVAAFTPRPQAPAGSLASIQLHQSMLNNVVASLDLGGREVGLRDLFREVATKLRRCNYQVPEDVPEDVTIELAAYEPISFACQDDRIHITLRIAKLSGGDGREWNDFEVRGMYLPSIEGVRVGLERDSYIRLKGFRRRLPMGDQVALRAIFARVLAQHPDVDLLGNLLVKDARLHDLRVTQFVICDGWIGIAVGAGDPVKMHIADDLQRPLTR